MTRYTRETFLTVGRRCFENTIDDTKFIERLLIIKKDIEDDYNKFVREKCDKSKAWRTARGGKPRYNKGNGRYNKRGGNSRSSRYEPNVAPALVNWRSYKAGKGKREADFGKTLNSLLNKISGDNFDKIQGKIFDMLGKTEDLYCTLEQLFEKAISQKSYCKYYAKIAANLDKTEDYKKIVKPAIVEYCQNLYKENSLLSSDVEDKTYDELCDYFKYKNRFIGNFQFIGELYRHSLLDITMIEDFWNILLKDIRAGGENKDSNSECICKLLSTIGNYLEKEYKKRGDNTLFNDLYIQPLEEFSRDKENFSNRIRFMFMDCSERKRWED